MNRFPGEVEKWNQFCVGLRCTSEHQWVSNLCWLSCKPQSLTQVSPKSHWSEKAYIAPVMVCTGVNLTNQKVCYKSFLGQNKLNIAPSNSAKISLCLKNGGEIEQTNGWSHEAISCKNIGRAFCDVSEDLCLCIYV